MVTDSDVGKVVLYYEDGWYAGYLEEITKKGWAVIIRIPKKDRNSYVTLPLTDVKSTQGDNGAKVKPNKSEIRKIVSRKKS